MRYHQRHLRIQELLPAPPPEDLLIVWYPQDSDLPSLAFGIGIQYDFDDLGNPTTGSDGEKTWQLSEAEKEDVLRRVRKRQEQELAWESERHA